MSRRLTMDARVNVSVVVVLLLFSGVPHAQNESVRIRAAVTKSLTLLQESGRTWIEKSGCVSCHHQAVPAVSVALARLRGFPVDETATRQRIEATLARFRHPREELFQGPAGIGLVAGGVLNAGYALVGLGAAQVPPNATTDAVAHFIAARQLADGRFRSPDPGRLPLEGSDVTATALSIRALQLYAPPALEAETATIVSRGRDWLLSAQPIGTEERASQLRGLGWADADTRVIARLSVALAGEQRVDGGWAQLPDLASDAYATGLALVALRDAGVLAASSAVYRRGVTFLLSSQHADGSWLVVSRARGTQPYFESGFPHGTNQFISAAGTAWATSALLLSLEE
jgi:hypothetical protein